MIRRLFTIMSAMSVALFILTCFLWRRESQRPRVTEADRLEWQRNEINAAVARAIAEGPLGRGAFETPEYKAQEARWNAWVRALADYQRREPAILAAERWRYVLLPIAILVALSAMPAAWIFLAWRRCERQLAAQGLIPPTRVQRAYRLVFGFLAVISAMLALLALAIWPRTYSNSDLFHHSIFFDRGDLTFWRLTSMKTGNGAIGICVTWQSGPKQTYRASTEESYRRINRPLSASPFHQTIPAQYPDFRSGRPLWNRWGFKWVHDEHDDPTRFPFDDYELVVPLWSVAAMSSLLPLFWLWRWNLRGRRFRVGCCTQCGYDLMGNTSGVCPECGAVIAREGKMIA